MFHKIISQNLPYRKSPKKNNQSSLQEPGVITSILPTQTSRNALFFLEGKSLKIYPLIPLRMGFWTPEDQQLEP